MDYYRESDLKRFVRIGIFVVAVIAVLAVYLRTLAEREVKADDPQGPRTAATDRSQSRSLSSAPPADPDSIEGRIQRWSNTPSGQQNGRPPGR